MKNIYNKISFLLALQAMICVVASDTNTTSPSREKIAVLAALGTTGLIGIKAGYNYFRDQKIKKTIFDHETFRATLLEQGFLQAIDQNGENNAHFVGKIEDATKDQYRKSFNRWMEAKSRQAAQQASWFSFRKQRIITYQQDQKNSDFVEYCFIDRYMRFPRLWAFLAW